MLMERSAGAIIFSVKYPRDVNFLLLKYSAGHWDFPKGNIENGEDETQAASREIREETGIENVVFLKGFERNITYNYRREQNLVRKKVIFFLAKAGSQKVILSNEHIAYSWNKFDTALAKLTYKTAKDILIDANNFLNKRIL